MAKTMRCLVVGIPTATFAAGSVRQDEAASISYAALSDHFPLHDALDLVIAPLFCADFDALELIDVLGREGFRGLLRIAAPKLPNRQVVLRELRTHAARQGISLDMIEEA